MGTPTTAKVNNTMSDEINLKMEELQLDPPKARTFNDLPKEIRDKIWAYAAHPMAIVNLHGLECQQFLATTTCLGSVNREALENVKREFRKCFQHRYVLFEDIGVVPQGIAATQFQVGHPSYTGPPIVILRERNGHYVPDIGNGGRMHVDHSCQWHSLILHEGHYIYFCAGDLAWLDPSTIDVARAYFGIGPHPHNSPLSGLRGAAGTHVMFNENPEMLKPGRNHEFEVVGPVMSFEEEQCGEERPYYLYDPDLIQLVEFTSRPFRFSQLEQYKHDGEK